MLNDRLVWFLLDQLISKRLDIDRRIQLFRIIQVARLCDRAFERGELIVKSLIVGVNDVAIAEGHNVLTGCIDVDTGVPMIGLEFGFAFDFVDTGGGDFVPGRGLRDGSAGRRGERLVDTGFVDPSFVNQIRQVGNDFGRFQAEQAFQTLLNIADLDCRSFFALGTGGIRVSLVKPAQDLASFLIILIQVVFLTS